MALNGVESGVVVPNSPEIGRIQRKEGPPQDVDNEIENLQWVGVGVEQCATVRLGLWLTVPIS